MNMLCFALLPLVPLAVLVHSRLQPSLVADPISSLAVQREVVRLVQANWSHQGAVLYSVRAHDMLVKNAQPRPVAYRFGTLQNHWLGVDKAVNGSLGPTYAADPPLGLVFTDLLAIELSISDALEAIRRLAFDHDLYLCYLCQPLEPQVTEPLYYFTTQDSMAACDSVNPNTFAIVGAISANVTLPTT
eukprot:TRINITY_DN16514_c0_g1_i11.p1 TRINITY_DN16514_c0_g1~~TRINITY_DN16514_c0_g1_i11.p1  ORF type:complete len:188 (-),score=30.34 TRINITY_DN16514_c0_g1_i11:407-970(-)